MGLQGYVLQDNRVDRLRLFVPSSNIVSKELVAADAPLVRVFSKAFESGDLERFELPLSGRLRLGDDGGRIGSDRGNEKFRKSDVNRIYDTGLEHEELSQWR